MTETQRRIRAYKRALPELRERVIAVALLLAMSASMLASASFAWITLSTAPEVSGMSTTVAANGNLEIALAQGLIKEPAQEPAESQVGDAASQKGIVAANTTWGNLVNLSDISYGLGAIELRPALMSTHSRDETPLTSASYGLDGRVVGTELDLGYTSYAEMEAGTGVYEFYAEEDKVSYGVRAISSIAYGATSGSSANDPMKQMANNFMKTANGYYTKAQDHYAALVSDGTGNKPTPLELKEGSGMYCVNTLEALVNIVANDKLSSGESDCGAYVPYLVRMMEELLVVLDHEGDALVTMANWQAYASGKSQDTKTFADADALRSASNADLQKYEINLITLAEHKSDRSKLQTAIAGMATYVEKAEKGEKVVFSEINGQLGSLVDIYTTEIGGKPFNQINTNDIMGSIGAVMGAKTVVVKKGVLKNVDLRVIPNDTNYRLYAKVKVKASILSLNPYVYTDAMNQEPTYVTDFDYTKDLVAQDRGGGRALDTYGMALDLWLRTNQLDAVLTLEGQVEYQKIPATTTVEGTTYELYTITVEEEEKDIFEKDGVWYYAETLQEVAEADLSGTPTQKVTQVPIDYRGENRIWEDWESMLDDGLIAKDTTTQGAGSCFVFYADPADQVKILDMLQSFTVKFVDQDYKDLGEAKLNIKNATENQGKVTVPLEMENGAGEMYVDETGVERTGIMKLVQNEPTLVTAIIYLNGSKLMNENVLAANELNGQLNIQFGTSSALIAAEDKELQKQYRTITAKAVIGGVETTNDVVELDYKAEGHNVVVTLNVDGEQPQSISGYFVRTINNSQGTRCEEIKFTPNEDGTWTGQFTQDEEGEWTKPVVLTNPGNYVLNSLIVDGIQYTLHDGTDGEHEANQPKVFIKGLKLGTVTAKIDGLPASGLYMTSDRSVPVAIEAQITSEMSISSVSAKITNKDKTKQYSAILSYNKNTGTWTGTANINSSDTYYLQLITVDGTTMDVPVQNEFTLKVGLSARVKTTVPAEDRSWTDEGQSVQLPMQVELINDNGTLQGELIKNLEHVYLKYEGISNSARMTWNAEKLCYEGVLAPLGAGIFRYEYISLGANGEMGRLYLDSVIGEDPPVFTAMSPNPPSYQSDMTEDKQTVIQSGTEATFHIVTADANAASVWAVIETPSGKEVTRFGEHVQNFQEQITFTLRNADRLDSEAPEQGVKEDGVWTLKKLLFQDVHDPEKDKDYALGGDEYYERDVSKENISTKVIANPVVTIEYDGKTQTKDLVEEVDVIRLGDEDTPFLEAQTTGALQVMIKDKFGDAIDGLKTVIWSIRHDAKTMDDYGNYSSRDGSSPYGIRHIVLESNEDGTIWTAQAQSLPVAGEYASIVNTFYDWNDETLEDTSGNKTDGNKVWRANFAVTTGKPTVTVAGISPKQGTSNRVYTGTIGSDGSVSADELLSGDFNRSTSYTATVYLNGSSNGRTVSKPSVTLELSGIEGNFTDASMAFGPTTYTFRPTELSKTVSIGDGENGSSGILGYGATNPKIFPAGKHTASTMSVRYGDLTLDVELTNAVTINQPQYPPYADFVINDAYTGTVPARVYSENGETITITLPDDDDVSTTWVEAKKDTATGTFVRIPDESSVTTYYETWKSNDCDKTPMYQKYDKHVEVSVADETVTTYNRTWTITGWKIGNTVYALGKEVTLTGNQTIRAVLTSVDSDRKTVENTVRRTTKYYVQGEDTSGNPEAGYTNITSDPDNGNKDRWTQSSPNISDVRTPKS